MNSLLKKYCVSVEFPDVSGAEHLELLQMRDRLTEIVSYKIDRDRLVSFSHEQEDRTTLKIIC